MTFPYALFAILGLASAAATVVGFLGLLVAMAFDKVDSDWFVKPMLLGLAGLIIAAIGGYAFAPASPLSRGIVAGKEHRSYTAMVMVGKTLVPQHHEYWRLSSTEGAHCDVTPQAYDGYRAGDAVVCAWRP